MTRQHHQYQSCVTSNELFSLRLRRNQRNKVPSCAVSLSPSAQRLDLLLIGHNYLCVSDSQDLDLDAILGELSQLESECQEAINRQSLLNLSAKKKEPIKSEPGHRRTPSFSSGAEQRVSFLSETESELRSASNGARTDSPDNDSAFSDNVSLLSGDSSASSGGSGGRTDASSKSSGLGFGFSQVRLIFVIKFVRVLNLLVVCRWMRPAGKKLRKLG